MKGGELKCADCGARAADVADVELNPTPAWGRPYEEWAVFWKCVNGHRNISGVRSQAKGFETVEVK